MLDKYILQITEKLGVKEEDIRSEYDKLLKEEATIHSDLSEEEQTKRALTRLGLVYKRQLRSPAVGFEGMVLAVGDCIDVVAKKKADAIKIFNQNPEQAIEAGLTDKEGIPLETKATWPDGRPNAAFGTPYPEHSYWRQVFGVATKANVEEDTPKYFIMSINGEKATKNVEGFKPVKFRAIDKTTSENSDSLYQLNASMFTEFEPSSMNLPPIKELIETYMLGFKTSLSKMEEYYELHKEDRGRIAVIEGDVSMLVLEPTSTGSRRMILEDDMSAIDFDSTGLTCWLPPNINIDFAEGSKVMVIGRLTQGKKRDADGNQTEEAGDMMMNVYSVYAIPEFKIEVEVEELTEDNSIVEDEEYIKEVQEEAPKPEEVKPEASEETQIKVTDW